MANPARTAVSSALMSIGAVSKAGEVRKLSRQFINNLDEQGFVVMPKEADSTLLRAALMAMTKHERTIPEGYGKQRMKQLLRYAAMVEIQRMRLAVLDEMVGQRFGGDGDNKAVEQAVERAVARILTPLPSHSKTEPPT